MPQTESFAATGYGSVPIWEEATCSSTSRVGSLGLLLADHGAMEESFVATYLKHVLNCTDDIQLLIKPTTGHGIR